jgi:hypothetical protein
MGFSTAVGTGVLMWTSPTGACNIDCAASAIAETETCGADTNGGCNAVPPVYQVLPSCNTIICGTAWADAKRCGVGVPTGMDMTQHPDSPTSIAITTGGPARRRRTPRPPGSPRATRSTSSILARLQDLIDTRCRRTHTNLVRLPSVAKALAPLGRRSPPLARTAYDLFIRPPCDGSPSRGAATRRLGLAGRRVRLHHASPAPPRPAR